MDTRPMTGGRASRSSSRATAKYEGWVRDHAVELFRFAYRLCGDRDTAEDIVQETFYEAWKSKGSLRKADRARAWLFQILRHRIGRWRRTEKRGPFLVSIDTVNIEIVSAGSEIASIESGELQKALDRLSDRLKLPLLMVLVQGMTCQQTADCLDLPLGTVLSRIHRAKKQLYEALLTDEENEGSTSRDTQHTRFQIGGEP